MKGAPFLELKLYERGTFSIKIQNGIQKGKGLDLGGWTSGVEPPCIKLCRVPPGNVHSHTCHCMANTQEGTLGNQG